MLLFPFHLSLSGAQIFQGKLWSHYLCCCILRVLCSLHTKVLPPMGLFLPQWLHIPLCAILCTLFTLYNVFPCLYMPKMYVSGHGKLSPGMYPAQFSHRLKTKHPSPSSVVIIQCSKSTSGLVWVAHFIVIPNLLSSNAQLTKLTT